MKAPRTSKTPVRQHRPPQRNHRHLQLEAVLLPTPPTPLRQLTPHFLHHDTTQALRPPFISTPTRNVHSVLDILIRVRLWDIECVRGHSGDVSVLHIRQPHDRHHLLIPAPKEHRPLGQVLRPEDTRFGDVGHAVQPVD